jgi:tetratricopeptide (TPR) repeat protein
MRPIWRGVGHRPDITGLHESVAAEVLLCVGTLTGWIGSRNQIKGAQETAKDLLTESAACYELVGDQRMIAVAHVELAFCYWREGAINEARIMLSEALKKLTTEGDTRARALLKLTTVECSAGRFKEALKILNDNASLFQNLKNHTTKGSYHTELAIILRNLAIASNQNEYSNVRLVNMNRRIMNSSKGET